MVTIHHYYYEENVLFVALITAHIVSLYMKRRIHVINNIIISYDDKLYSVAVS